MTKAKVLVTGGSGFIGREVVNQLLDNNFSVSVICGSNFIPQNKKDLLNNVEIHTFDVRESDKLKFALKGVSYCIHLAGLIGGLDYIQKYPATVLTDNNAINATVFKTCSQQHINRLIFISSGLVFERANTFPLKETDLEKLPPPISTYGLSKMIGESYCKAYQKETGLKYSIARLFNVYGPFQKHNHLIPELIKKINSAEYPLSLYGGGNQTRCMTYITDAASGIIATMTNKTAVNTDFNISSDKEYLVRNIAKKIWQLTGRSEKFKIASQSKLSIDVLKRIPSVTKAKRLLKWSAKIGLDEGLRKTLEV